MSSEKWIPEGGKLIARRMVGKCVDEVVLGFHDKPGDEFTIIAVMRNFSAQAYFSRLIECCEGSVDHSGSGNIIIRNYVNNLTLRAFAKLWDCPFSSFAQWVDAVDRYPHLADGEKKRLRQLVQQAA